MDESDVEVAAPAAPAAGAERSGYAPRVAARAAVATVSAGGSSVDGRAASACEPDRVLP